MSPKAQGLRLGAAFMLGVACALWLFPVLAGRQIQQLRIERDEAIAQVEVLRKQVAQLEETERKQQGGQVIKRAHAHIEGPNKDRRVALEVERRLQKRLSEREGDQVAEVSFLILYSQFQGSLFEVDGVVYQLEVKALAIGPDLVLYGWITPISR